MDRQLYNSLPLLDIRLHSTGLRVDIAPQGNIHHVRIFSAVALLILIIACINFVNLATARAALARYAGLSRASVEPLGAGLINETFLVSTGDARRVRRVFAG